MSDFKLMAGITRRQFLRGAALAVTTFNFIPAQVLGRQGAVSPNSRLNLAGIGIGGQGGGDLSQFRKENIVALCDVDAKYAARAFNAHPQAKRYQDFRKMLEEQKDIDAVTVATPDHLHAFVSIMAMKLGKHVYCQKPLTHSVFEAREMRRVAKEQKVVTQMGNQGSAENGLRRAVEIIQAGILGSVRQVHVWSNRPIWPQGMRRPEGSKPVPEGLDWDLWLGPAPERPFNDGYLPFVWRGWQDFGTGALGDMACHTANMPFRALELGYPTEIEAESSGINQESYPKQSKIRFEFPERGKLPALTFWWYDGGNKPPAEVTRGVSALTEKLPGSGCLLVGDKGQLYSPDDYGAKFYLMFSDEKEFKSGNNHEAIKSIPQNFTRSPGHYVEWLNAIRGGPAAYSNFDIAAYLTEIILLGCVALRVGKKLEWDGPKMQALNAPEAAQYVRRRYREGWKL